MNEEEEGVEKVEERWEKELEGRGRFWREADSKEVKVTELGQG